MLSLKSIFRLFIISLLSLNISAQNNGGFENWVTLNGYEEPVNWQTFNVFSLFGNPICATKVGGVDKYAGNYALKITSKYFPFKIVTQQPDTIGFAFNGKITISPPSYAIGSPYTSRPSKLTFYAKYIPVGLDNGYAGVVLYGNLPTGRDTIAEGTIIIPPNPSYAQYVITLNYRSNTVPDSANIYFQASNSGNGKRVGSSLYIDEVKFVDFVGVEEYESNSAKVNIYPNPANDVLTIQSDIEEAEKVEITDVLGRVINTYRIQNSEVKVNVTQYENGSYFYKLLNKKNEPLTFGKFSVQK